MTAAATAELAATGKEFKYVEPSMTYLIIGPRTFESLDPIGFKAMLFSKEFGRHLTLATTLWKLHIYACISVPVYSIAAL